MRRRIVVLAYRCDPEDVGESWSAHRWVSGISRSHDVTLLTTRRAGQGDVSESLPGVEVVSFEEPAFPRCMERLDSMLKPGYARFFVRARAWLEQEVLEQEVRGSIARPIDLIHQIAPLALRYPCPAVGLGVPFVLGPVGGSLEAPSTFRSEIRSPWYARLRDLDGLRLRHDPWLRRSFSEASSVIGVAPYVRSVLRDVSLRRFSVCPETAVDRVPRRRETDRDANHLRLLYVGRVIRTKGVRDAIRAVSRLKTLRRVTLDVVGDGDDLGACRAEARHLGVESQVRFHGKVTRTEVEAFYQEADAFCFPSFREPSGNVVFEALSHGLPVITSDRGGPAAVVSGDLGVTVPARDPETYASELAHAIDRMAEDPEQLRCFSRAARLALSERHTWRTRIEWMLDHYESVLASSPDMASSTISSTAQLGRVG